MNRLEYVNKLINWMYRSDDTELRAAVGEHSGLDGIYQGTSQRTHKLLRIAYYRGVRRGLGLAWEAKQPLTIREAEETADDSDDSEQRARRG